MADTGDDVYITINYCGVEKRIGLSVQPSLELSDRQVDSAEHDLHARLRDLFHVPEDVLFYLHEAETARIMSKESFREPGYTQNFPRHWYLVRPIINNGATDVDAANGESSMVTEGTHNGLQVCTVCVWEGNEQYLVLCISVVGYSVQTMYNFG